MPQLIQFLCTIALSVTLFIGGFLSPLFLGSAHTLALAEPVTPEAVSYEIGKANSPKEAAESIKNKAQGYKQELKEDSNYTANTAKKIASQTQDQLQQTTDNLSDRSRQLSDRASRNSDDLIENAENKLKSAADTVREKLNLDEPIPQSTRDFLGDVESKVDSSVSPVTGKTGYYKDPHRP